MSIQTIDEHKIAIDVATSYVAAQSDPDLQRYVFTYTVTIRNEGASPSKLLARHWIITDANGKSQEVQGDGVVGEQPYLRPGESFEYTSWTMIETPVGSMGGSYNMLSDEGVHFKAPIQTFTLSIPRVLH